MAWVCQYPLARWVTCSCGDRSATENSVAVLHPREELHPISLEEMILRPSRGGVAASNCGRGLGRSGVELNRVGPCRIPVSVQQFADGQQTLGLGVIAQGEALPGQLKGRANPVVTQVRQTVLAQGGVF